MEATFQALKEVIAQARPRNDGPNGNEEPTSTEFFALICSLLSSNSAATTLDYDVLLDILTAVTPHASKQIVRLQFKSIAIVILKRLQHVSDDAKAVVSNLNALGTLMFAQETGIWETVYALQSLNAVLSFIDHSSPKVRKVVSDILRSLLSSHMQKSAKQLRSYIGEFCREVLKMCSRSEYKRSLYLLTMLESSAAALLPQDAVLVCELAIRLHTCEQPVLTAGAYRMLDSFFQSFSFGLSSEQTLHLLKQLLHNAPKTLDMEASSFYFTSLASAYVQVFKVSTDRAAGLISKVTTTILTGLDSDFTQVHCAVGTALKRVILTCISDEMVKDALSVKHGQRKASSASAAFTAFLSNIEDTTELRYQKSWMYALDAVRSLVSRLGPDNCIHLAGNLIVKMGRLYEAVHSSAVEISAGNQVFVFDALGHTLRVVGVAGFLTLLPLSEKKKAANALPLDSSKDWLINLLLSNLKLMPCKLADFVSIMLQLARKCSLVAASNESQSLTMSARSKVIQLWSLFPGFCYYGPIDIASTFPTLTVTLEKALGDSTYPEIGNSITTGLTHLIQMTKQRQVTAQPTPDMLALQASAPSLLTCLLKLLESMESSDSRYQGSIRTVEMLASISSYQLIAAVSKKLIEMLLSSTGAADDSDETSSWLAILMTLIPYLKENLLVVIYRTVRPLLAVKESSQKRAYLVLETLLRHHAATIQAFESRMQILSLLSQYLLTCGVNARHMRLRCIGTLLSTIDDEAELQNACAAIIGEILICLKDCNKKSRVSAFEVLEILVSRLSVDFLFAHIQPVLASGDSTSSSAALTALCALALSRKLDPILLRYIDELIPSAISMLDDDSPEITKSVLNYLQICVSILPQDTVEAIVPDVLDAATRCIGPLKTKFISKVRSLVRKLSRKVNEELLREHLYDSDKPLLDYILRQDRKRKQKEASRRKSLDEILGSDSDSDSEDGDTDVEEKPRKRLKATRASIAATSSFPSSLGDLMEERTTSSNHKHLEAMDTTVPADEDKDYQVVVDADGRVVVQARPVEVEAIADEKDKDKDRAIKSEVVQQKKRTRDPGEEYRSKKAGGDVWRRGQLEPHAYIPLDPKMLSKKNSGAVLAQFGSVLANRNGFKKQSQRKSRGPVGNRKQRIATRKHSAGKR